MRLSSIGDILLATPFIRQVRIAFPKARIDFVIKKEFYPLIRFNPHLNKIYSYDKKTGMKGLERLSQSLSEQKYDLVFDLHNNFRTRYLVSKIKVRQSFKIHKDKIKRALLVYLKLNTYKTVTTIPQRYLAVGQSVGVKDDDNGLEIFWKDSIELEANNILQRHRSQNKFIVLAAGAAHYTKRWPIDKYMKLAEKILAHSNASIVIMGNEKEREMLSSLVISPRIINLAGKVSLLLAAVILGKAHVVVSNDTGLMHMATAVNTPVVAIFGSTVKELGFFPYKGISVVHEVQNLWCRPCSHIGRKKCPLGHFKCMLNIEEDDVFASVIKFLNGK